VIDVAILISTEPNIKGLTVFSSDVLTYQYLTDKRPWGILSAQFERGWGIGKLHYSVIILFFKKNYRGI